VLPPELLHMCTFSSLMVCCSGVSDSTVKHVTCCEATNKDPMQAGHADGAAPLDSTRFVRYGSQIVDLRQYQKFETDHKVTTSKLLTLAMCCTSLDHDCKISELQP
jgi:hypothetical protein